MLDSYPEAQEKIKLKYNNLVLYICNIKAYLCFPEGYKVKEDKVLSTTFESINHITITNDSGEKQYATSLLFYVVVNDY
jgi:hypothetical protein